MPLTEKQLKGAWMLANGRTDRESYQAAGVTERTFYKWKGKTEFVAAVNFLAEQRESEIAAKAEEIVSLASARDDEEKALKHQRLMVEGLGELSVDLIAQIRADGVENLGPRFLGPIVKSFAESVSMLQASNDRLVGIESLLTDAKAPEQEFVVRVDIAEPPQGYFDDDDDSDELEGEDI